MTTVLDLSQWPISSLQATLFGNERINRSRLLPGGDVIQPMPMLWGCPGDALNLPHLTSSVTPEVDIYCLRNSSVGGAGSHVQLDGNFIYSKSFYPDYIKHYVENNILTELWDFGEKNPRKVEYAFCICHFNFIWGHWLLEIYPKLFAIKELRIRGFVAPIILPDNAPAYVKAIIEYTVPGQETIIYDRLRETIEVKNLILPHMYQERYTFNRHFANHLEGMIESDSRPTRLIYIARKQSETLTSYRHMDNEQEIRGIALDKGLEIIYPEDFGWGEQVKTFSEARLIVGEFGSGLHNALVSRPGTFVVALNWVGVDVQSRIANFRSQHVGYILPSDGTPRVHSLNDPKLQNYSINPQEFAERIGSCVDGLIIP